MYQRHPSGHQANSESSGHASRTPLIRESRAFWERRPTLQKAACKRFFGKLESQRIIPLSFQGGCGAIGNADLSPEETASSGGDVENRLHFSSKSKTRKHPARVEDHSKKSWEGTQSPQGAATKCTVAKKNLRLQNRVTRLTTSDGTGSLATRGKKNL